MKSRDLQVSQDLARFVLPAAGATALQHAIRLTQLPTVVHTSSVHRPAWCRDDLKTGLRDLTDGLVTSSRTEIQPTAMTGSRSTWVGLLDLDSALDVASPEGPPHTEHDQAQVLIRVHGAPVGYITVPAGPIESLTNRARAAAEVDLADALRRHSRCDAGPTELRAPGDLQRHLACPQRFSSAGGAGISIVVCTRNRPSMLMDCLAALRRVPYAPLEILVVDNAPADDATLRAVSALTNTDQRVRYVREPNPGLSRARNRGLEGARHSLVAFTDDDTIADPGWPAALAAAFAADPQTCLVTGLVAPMTLETRAARYFEARYERHTTFEPLIFDRACRPAPMYPYTAGIFGIGANFAVRRDDITGIGGFDPLLGVGGPGRGGEDLDIFLRVILSGGHIRYMPSALIWHRHRPHGRALARQVFDYGHGLGAYLAKHQADPELRRLMLRHGVRHAATQIGRIRNAVRTSRTAPSGGLRLTAIETFGFIAGAANYRNAARKSVRPTPV